jgi:hypothetical protein
MATYYKCEVKKVRKYYLNAHQQKEYFTGEHENDKVLYEAAILTSEGISTEEEVVYTGFGETPDEAAKSAKIFACINLPKYKKLTMSEPQSLETAKDITWLETRIKETA